MDKWRNKVKVVTLTEDSLLPPTRRAANYPPASVDKPKSKKWSLDGIFRKVSSILEAQSSSSSLEDLQERHHRRKPKGKSKSYGLESPEGSESVSMDQLLEARLSVHSHSRSSDGSQETGRRPRCRARAEAKRRDRLCVQGDSSMDESSAVEQEVARTAKPAVECKRRSRASRTERYLKRMCNGSKTSDEGRAANEFRPIERVPRTDPLQHGDAGVNPLVQQTLQFFSEFDRSMALAEQQKARKPCHRRKSTQAEEINRLQQQQPSQIPPKPPSRDHRSRILVNGMTLDKYQQMLKDMQKQPDVNFIRNQCFQKENGCTRNELNDAYDQYGLELSPNSTMHKYHLPLNSPTSPLKKTLNTNIIEENGSYERNQSLLDVKKTKLVDQTPRFSTNLQRDDYENSNYVPFKKCELEKSNERRSSKNLEEALCELEAIYNSLQLGDEELLERAEKRTMEEFHYKGFTASPDGFDNENSSSRRKTWDDTSLSNYKEEPDRLKDDMAYRRMHPKERPSSVDGQLSLNSISYLMTSPIPSRREMLYVDPKRKSRRKEPDVTLDDVVFRSMQYANHTLKVVEPQPPFGIPLGPITTATDSDYLHTCRTKPERARSPYIPNYEPDLVTDDLAFRNLRKDAQFSSSSRQPSPSFLSMGTTSPLSFGFKKKRAVRSLSANLYGLINKPDSATSPTQLDSEDLISVNTNSTFDDFFDDVPVKRLGRRTSDPELMTANWQKNTWDSLDINKNRDKETEGQGLRRRQLPRENSSELDLSNASYDESSDERVSSRHRSILADAEMEYKGSSDKGSSYLSSNSSTPPPLPIRNVEPISEQEISVYKKLCQDLENLVQLTKSVDSVPAKNESSGPSVQTVVILREESLIPKTQRILASCLNESEDNSSFKDIFKSDDQFKVIKQEEDEQESPLKREISTILDNLKSLREDSSCSLSSCSEEEKVKKDVVEEKSFKEITKEICDLVIGSDEDIKGVEPTLATDKEEQKEEEKEEEEEEEKEEKKDKVDDGNVFFKNAQLAKKSGDWKESTPNNAVVNRRTSLTSVDNSHWEGMNKCNHKYNSMPAKTSSLLPFRHYGSKRKSSKRKSMCSIS